MPKVSGRKSVRNPDVKDIKENITKTDSRLYLPNSRPIIGANTAPTLAIEEQVPIPVFLKYCERMKNERYHLPSYASKINVQNTALKANIRCVNHFLEAVLGNVS